MLFNFYLSEFAFYPHLPPFPTRRSSDLAQKAGRTHRISKGAIKGAGVFCRIGHDADIDKAVVIKYLAQGSDPTVHHVTWRYNIHARLCLGQGLLTQYLYRGLIEHIPLIVDDAILTVAGIWIQSHISQNAYFRKALFQLGDDARYEPLGISSLFTVRRLEICLDIGK